MKKYKFLIIISIILLLLILFVSTRKSTFGDGSSCHWYNPYCCVVETAIDKVLSNAVSSIAGCEELATEGAAACEVAGGGPEDPAADACATAMGIGLLSACEGAVDAGVGFTTEGAKQSIGCG
jgi:hypothetical protein